MKKIVAIWLAGVLLLSLMAGCAGGKAPVGGDGDSTSTTSAGFVKPTGYVAVLRVTINPQFDLYIDAEGRVLAVECVNADAKALAPSIETDTDLETVVASIVTAANAEGFIRADTTVSLELVEATDEADADLLQKASQAVAALSDTAQISVAVQTKVAASVTTTTTAKPSDGKYDRALTALENGDIGEAYKLLCSTTDERAAALLHHFVWQPVQVWGENASSRTYDSEGYPATATYGISTYTYTWNAAGQLAVKRSDENSATKYWEQTDYTYENGLLVKRVRTSLYDSGETETFTYDGSGNLLQWNYDSSYDADDYTRTYTYDAQGNRLSMDIQVANGSGRYVTYTYDGAGHLLSKVSQYNDGNTERMTRTFNEKGQMVTMQNVLPYGTNNHTYTYGERGELLSESSEWVGESAYIYRYTYDEFGRRTAMIVERGGEEVNRHTYTYDGDESLTFVGGGSTWVCRLFYYPKEINQELILDALNGMDYYDYYIE